MTDITIPVASAVFGRAAAELIMHGETKLAADLTAVHRATCDLAKAVQAEHTAQNPSQLAAARVDSINALLRLRGLAASEADAARERVYQQTRPQIDHLQTLLAKHRGNRPAP